MDAEEDNPFQQYRKMSVRPFICCTVCLKRRVIEKKDKDKKVLLERQLEVN
jgi:hypothetical protein